MNEEWAEAPAAAGRMRSFEEMDIQLRGGFYSELSRQEHEPC